MTLTEAIDAIEGDNTMILSFTRRRKDLEVVVAMVWALKDGGYAGFTSVQNIERLKPARMDRDALVAALVREGYRDDLENKSIQIDDARSLADLEYTYRNMDWPPFDNPGRFTHGNG